MEQQRSKETVFFQNLGILLICLAFFLFTFTKFGIRVGTFKFLPADLCIILAAGIAFFTKKRKIYSQRVNIFLVLTGLLFLATVLSVFSIADARKYLVGVLPWLFTLVFLYAGLHIYRYNPIKFTKWLQRAIALTIIVCAIPAYLYFFLQIRIPVCYDPVRYKAFTVNANQITSLMLISIFIYGTLDLSRRKIPMRSLLLVAISFVPILLSGSRTGAIILVLFTLLFLFVTMLNLNFKGRLLGVILFIIIGTVSFNKIIALSERVYVINRAIQGFEMIAGTQELDNSAKTRQDQSHFGIELFYSNPITGIGIGNFTHYYQNEVHNSFISSLFETGILGFFLLVCLWIFLGLTILLSSNISRITKLYLFSCLVLFAAMNTYHIYMRERWVWFFFLFIVYVSSPIYKSIRTNIKKEKKLVL